MVRTRLWLIAFSIAALSGCSLTETVSGDIVRIGGNLGGAVTGLFKNSNGQIVAYCCDTACVTAESAKEFKNEFVKALAAKVSDDAQRTIIMGRVTFHNIPVQKCNNNADIVFKLKYDVGGYPMLTEQPISLESLKTNDENDGSRKALGKLLKNFDDEFQNGARLEIHLKECDGTEEATGQAPNLGNCAPDNSDSDDSGLPSSHGEPGLGGLVDSEPPRAGQCQTCEPSPTKETEHDFDWSGIID